MEPARDLKHLGFRRRPSKSTCPARIEVKRVCWERASKRWSALLTQTKSRIGHNCGMRKRLGEANWAAFVKYAFMEPYMEAAPERLEDCQMPWYLGLRIYRGVIII